MKKSVAKPVEIKGLDIGYPAKTIYHDLDLCLMPGDMVCLLGQNGVGKSTLLKTLAGLIPSMKGSVLINGDPLETLDKHDLAKRVSIVTTEKQLASGLSVLDVLLAGRYPYQKWLSSPAANDFDIIAKAADQTNINYLLDKRLDELSDGQRQKVMIARALVQNTKIVLLDEPPAHLDLTNRVEIMRFLGEIARIQKKTLLISTHELSLALQFANQLWLMNFGEPIICGGPEDLAISGQLNRIYHHQNFEYDLITGKIKSPDKLKNRITVKAPVELSYWIMNALDRVRYRPDNHVTIKADAINNVLQWQLIEGEKTYKGVTINELLKQINGQHELTSIQ